VSILVKQINFYTLFQVLIKNKVIFYLLFFILYFLVFYFDELNISFSAFIFNNLFLIFFSFIFFYFLITFKGLKWEILYISLGLGLINGLWIIFLFKYINWIYAFLGFILAAFILSIFWYFKFIFFYLVFTKFKGKFFPTTFTTKFINNLVIYFFLSIFYSFYYVFIEFIQYNLKDLDMSFCMTYFTQSSNYFFFWLFKINPFLVTFITIFIVTFLAFILSELFISLESKKTNYQLDTQENQIKEISKNYFYLISFLFSIYFIVNFFSYIYFKAISKNKALLLENKLLKDNVEFILISTNIDSYFNEFNKRNYEELFNKLRKITKEVYNEKEKIKVLLIPEGALIKNYDTLFYLENNKNTKLFDIFSEFVFEYLVFNTIAVDKDFNIYNSIVLYNKQEGKFNFYLKRYLVPFGEYYPNWFLKIFGFLDIDNLKYKSYSSGFYFKDNQNYFKIKDISFKVLICFESFKYEMKSDIDKKIDFILVSSNDMWFKNLFMDSLHLKSIKILSIYSDLPVIFNANGNKNVVISISNFSSLRNIKIY
jgi:apolipoprotein N-acyltransferase